MVSDQLLKSFLRDVPFPPLHTDCRVAFEKLTMDKSNTTKTRMLRILRKAASVESPWLLPYLPTHRRLGRNPFLRQQFVVIEECIPASIKKMLPSPQHWIYDLFRDAIKSIRLHGACRRGSSMAHKMRLLAHIMLHATQIVPDVRTASTREEWIRQCAESNLVPPFRRFLCMMSPTARRPYRTVIREVFRDLLKILTFVDFDVLMKCEPISVITGLYDNDADADVHDCRLAETQMETNKPARVRTGLTIEEQRRLCDAATTTREMLIVHLLLTTGMRQFGLCNIEVKAVTQWNTVTGQRVALDMGTTMEKGGILRSFVIFDVVKPILEKWVNVDRPSSHGPFLFPSATVERGQLCTRTIRSIFHSLCQRANVRLTHQYTHVTRHTVVRNLRAANTDMDLIAAYVGHADPSTTKKYYCNEDYDAVIKKLDLTTLVSYCSTKH